MEAGIDIGYSHSKVEGNGKRSIFASVEGTPDRSRISVASEPANEIRLLYPREVLIGSQAVLQSRNLNRREDRRWIESDLYKDLLLAAFTELTTATHADLTVVSGLPVQFYMHDKDALLEQLLGEHKVQREGRPSQSLTVTEARVIPQGFGALLAVCLDDRGNIARADIANGNIGIVDVGGKTTGLLSVNRLTEVSRETASVNTGAWNVVRAVRQWLAAEYPDLEIRDHALIEAIQARQVNYFGAPVDLTVPIDNAVEPFADEVIAEAGQLWNGAASLDMILVAGGGAHMIGSALRSHFRHAQIIDVDPVYANAIGYWKLARRMNRNKK